jgi:hypothetical protein
MSFTQSILYLIIGWVMGILSPIIADGIKARREAAQIKTSVAVEMRELLTKLAPSAISLAIKLGKLDRQLLLWHKSIAEITDGIETNITDMLLTLPDENIALAAKSKYDPDRSLSLVKYNTPVLDAHLAKLAIFSKNTQNNLMKIKGRMAIYYECVDEARSFASMTFDQSQPSENHSIIRNNLMDTYDTAMKHAIYACNLIHDYLLSER